MGMYTYVIFEPFFFTKKTQIYIYIYIEREREREDLGLMPWEWLGASRMGYGMSMYRYVYVQRICIDTYMYILYAICNILYTIYFIYKNEYIRLDI